MIKINSEKEVYQFYHIVLFMNFIIINSITKMMKIKFHLIMATIFGLHSETIKINYPTDCY